jgi:uncharacterized membrane protein YkvA (DUF1232 family)
MSDAPDFVELLRVFSNNYLGKRERAVRHAGDICEFYARVFIRCDLNREQRATVNSVLAYFMVNGDLYPEERLGPFGLVDDLYVATYAFRTLRREVRAEDLISCWPGLEPLDQVMDEVYRECRAEIGKRTKEVLRLAGLN